MGAVVRSLTLGPEEAKTITTTGEPRAWQSCLQQEFRPGGVSLAC